MHHDGHGCRNHLCSCNEADIHSSKMTSIVYRYYAHNWIPNCMDKVQEALALFAPDAKGTLSAPASEGLASLTSNSDTTLFRRSAVSPVISPLAPRTLRMAASPFLRSETSAGSSFGMAVSVAS